MNKPRVENPAKTPGVCVINNYRPSYGGAGGVVMAFVVGRGSGPDDSIRRQPGHARI